jgi:hypothetical protein
VSSFANNHIASRSYLGNWVGDGGQLMRVTGSFPFLEEFRNPRSVGKRFRFFEDPEVAETAEQWLGRYEGRAAPVLRDLSPQWPLNERKRWAISCLIAIHLYRNPAGVHKIRELSVREMERRRSEYVATMNESQQQVFYREISSEKFLVEYISSSIPTIAALIDSTHWTLIQFPEPLLATSDQPVVVVPLMDSGSAPLETLPATGLMGIEELRMALSPELALLCTWRDGPDGEPPLSGSEHLAAELNRAVIGQRDQEWFYRPGRRPNTITATNFDTDACHPVGRMVFPGYGLGEVRGSQRYRETTKNVETMVETDTGGQVIITRCQPSN